MATRVNLMIQIAELDLQLSKAGGEWGTQQQANTLHRCAEILDSAEEADEDAISRAVHCLMRKHQLHPTAHWPDAYNH